MFSRKKLQSKLGELFFRGLLRTSRNAVSCNELNVPLAEIDFYQHLLPPWSCCNVPAALSMRGRDRKTEKENNDRSD